ncbi:MAG: hypothetical protein H6581_28195 [Bacteroidia bacterium]|nr:hypothetical protein [Bacteroidia bacterium]
MNLKEKEPMTYRLLTSFSAALIAFTWLSPYWHVLASYNGSVEEYDFILKGFPLPWMVTDGIVAVFGNSFDIAVCLVNGLIDLAFWLTCFWGLTFSLRRYFNDPSKGLIIFIWIWVGLGVLHEWGLMLVVVMGDLHPWFQDGYKVISVGFDNAEMVKDIWGN